jgi:hypothetical protein
MKKLFANIFFFFALLPFISPYPIGSDAQPIAFLLGASLIFLLFLENNLKLSLLESIFILLSLFSLIFLGIDNFGEFDIKQRLGLFFGAVTFIAASKLFYIFSFKVLALASFVNFFGVLWHLISPDSFVPVAELFIRKVKLVEISTRGVSGFAPENSFASILAIFHIVLAYYFYSQNKCSKQSFIILSILAVLVIVMTSSGSGYMFAFLLLAIFILSKLTPKVVFTSLIFIPIIMFAFLQSSLVDSRGGALVKLAINNPSLLLVDGSIAERALALDIGFKSLITYPFGKGAGAYSTIAPYIEEKFSLSLKYPSARKGVMMKETISPFARYLTEIGLVFIVFSAYLFLKAFRWNSYSLISVTFAFLLFIVSFSIIFPPTYFLLASSLKFTPRVKYIQPMLNN